MPWLKILFCWLAVINLLAFALAAFDKHRARCGGRRIREATLFLVAAIGGGLGLYVAMVCLRHKTKHLSFMLGVPLIIAAHILLLVLLLLRPFGV